MTVWPLVIVSLAGEKPLSVKVTVNPDEVSLVEGVEAAMVATAGAAVVVCLGVELATVATGVTGVLDAVGCVAVGAGDVAMSLVIGVCGARTTT